MKKLFFLTTLAILFAFTSCEQNTPWETDEETGVRLDNVLDNVLENQYASKIVGHRGFKWRFKPNKPFASAKCKTGKGICVTAGSVFNPDITDLNLPDKEIEGVLARKNNDTPFIKLYLFNSLIEEYPDLLVDNKIVFEEYLTIDDKLAIELGFNQSISLQSGNYDLLPTVGDYFFINVPIK